MSQQCTTEQLDAVIAGVAILKAHLTGEQPELTNGWVLTDPSEIINGTLLGELLAYSHPDLDVVRNVASTRTAFGLGQTPFSVPTTYLYVRPNLAASASR
jgi:hypothetical protein